MESRPKYIEVDSHYELDEGFVDGIMELNAHHRLRVLRQINSAIEDLEQDDDDTLFAGGRVGSDLYYKFEYYTSNDFQACKANHRGTLKHETRRMQKIVGEVFCWLVP